MGTWALRELMLRPSALGGRPGDIPLEEIERLRAEVESEARHAVEGLEEGALPLRLPKSKVTQLLSCEAYAVGGRTAQPERISAAQARGMAADHVVSAWCGGAPFGGAGSGDAVEAAEALIEAYRDPALLHWWHTGDPSEREELAGSLSQVSEGLVSEMGALDPAWAVRTQVPAAVVLAGGAVVCEGRFDLELGGPPSALPGAIVDVKTGSHADAARTEHADDLLIYALLATFRDDRAPAWVGTWHATQASLDARPVALGALEAAAGRLMVAIGRLAELRAGRVPEATGGPQCQWCDLRPSCPSALPADRS